MRVKKGVGHKKLTVIYLVMLMGVAFVCTRLVNELKNYKMQLEEEKLENENQKEAYEGLLFELESTKQELETTNQELESENQVLKEKVAELTDPGYGIKAYGQLAVNNGQLVSENGEAVLLRGLSSHGINWYPKYINAAGLATLKEYGANVFRIAMYTDQNGGYVYEKEQNKTYLYIAIENVLSQDMYAIVDWHVLMDENPLRHMEEAKAFFEEISSHYAGNKGIIYEICNEPNGATSWEDIYAYANQIIPIIRKNSPDAVIIVGTPEFSSQLLEPMEKPLEYDNIMYTYHQYIDITERKEADYYQLSKAVEEKFPVFVSEWGISYGDRDDTNIHSYEDESLHMENAHEFLVYLKENNISWCGWSLSNKAEAYSLVLNSCNKLSGWTKEDMTPSGYMMTQALTYCKEK